MACYITLFSLPAYFAGNKLINNRQNSKAALLRQAQAEHCSALSLMVKLKPLSPSANKVLAVIDLLIIMIQRAQLRCVMLCADSSKLRIIRKTAV